MASGREAAESSADGARRLVLAAISVVALGCIVWGVVAQHEVAVLPSGVRHRVLAEQTVDGFESRTPAELEHLLQKHGLERPVTLETVDGPETVTLVPEISGALLVITLLTALAYWAVCLFALAPRIRRPGIADLFTSLLLGALLIAIGGTSAPVRPGGYVLSLLFLAAASFLGPFAVRFSRVYPRPVPSRWSRWLPSPVLLALGATVAAWNAVVWLRAMAAPGASGVHWIDAPEGTLRAFLAFCVLIACWNLYSSSRTARLDRERRQAKWILLGLAIGATPWVLLRAFPRILPGVGPSWPPWGPGVDRLVEMMVPLTLTIAVARERFLDIDVLIRRSVIYTLLALAGAALFFGTALLLAQVVAHGLDLPEAWARWAWAVAGAITGLLFRPGRRAIGRWVDRIFFRLRHSHDEALEALDRNLAAARGQQEVAAQLCDFLEQVLQPKAAGACVSSGDGWERCGAFADAEQETLEGVAAAGSLVARPDATGAPEVESSEWPEPLTEAGLRLVQPIRTGDLTLGLLLVGEKRTERHYLQEDLAVLGAAADRAGIQLERLALVQQVAEEAMAHRALEEVARQKTEFFARLAHDLRTPITAVRWSVQNLLDGLPGPLTERQGEYLEGVGAAAAQLSRLVENLVDLGRMDLEAPRRPDEPVDLAAVAEEVASALAVVARERRATTQLDIEEGLPPIRGRKEAAFQIVINLVDNALKYTAPDTAVEVGLRAHDEGRSVVLTVRDHGPGLPEDPEALFTLFHQGPESPHAQARGFGIGLHIVRTWTESLGGHIAAENATGGGALFACRLPCWTEEEIG